MPEMTSDSFLRTTFAELLKESEGKPLEERLIAYDACDDQEVKAPVGMFRKRLDSRRNTKPKKPDNQVRVCEPFNPSAFNFTKIANSNERLLHLEAAGSSYSLLTNKFPLFKNHMLLAADAMVAQQMTLDRLSAVTQLLKRSSFCAYFNSWMASASVNHFHCHLIDERPPVTEFPLSVGPLVNGERCLVPRGFAGSCYVFAHAQLALIDAVIIGMQACNQPHNLLFTQQHVYVFPKPLERPARSFELYPETVGGPELIGSFTTYTQPNFDSLSETAVEELVRINTAALPAWMLAPRNDRRGARAAPVTSQTRPAAKRQRAAATDDEYDKPLVMQRSVSFELVSF